MANFLRVQGNYVLWRAAGAMVTYLTEDVRKRQLKYYTTLSGKTEREARWKECIDMVTGRYFFLLFSKSETNLNSVSV